MLARGLPRPTADPAFARSLLHEVLASARIVPAADAVEDERRRRLSRAGYVGGAIAGAAVFAALGAALGRRFARVGERAA